MTFKFCDAPLLKNYISIKHVNVLVMGSSTECPTILTNCLIIFRMKSIPRVCQSISMPPMTATPIQSCSRRKRKSPTDERESFTWVFHQIDETVYSLPSFRLLEVMVSVHAENGGETVSSWREITVCSWWSMSKIKGWLKICSSKINNRCINCPCRQV